MTPPTKKFPFPGYYLLGMLRDPLRLFAEIAAVGDVVNYAAGDTPCCMVTHPERIKELLVDQARKLEKGPALQRAPRFLGQGLIVSDGPFHQRQRRLSQPAFARARIATYAREIVALAADHSERWQSGAEVDLYVDLQGLALRIVGAAWTSRHCSRATADRRSRCCHVACSGWRPRSSSSARCPGRAGWASRMSPTPGQNCLRCWSPTVCSPPCRAPG